MGEQLTVEKLREKYSEKRTNREKTRSENVFDSRSGSLESRTRLGSNPKYGSSAESLKNSFKEMADLHFEIADLAEEYGHLSVTLKDMLGSERIYNAKDIRKLAWYFITLNKKARVRVTSDAYGRKGETIGTLIDALSEVITDQVNQLYKSKDFAIEVKSKVINDMKKFDRDLIDTLRSSYTGTADRALVDKELRSIENELNSIQKQLSEKEEQVQAARLKEDMDLVTKLTDEMSTLLDKKEDFATSKLNAEEIQSNIKIEGLNYAAKIMDIKAALTANRANYIAATINYETVCKTLSKYENAKAYLMPVLKNQAILSASSNQLKNKQELLYKSFSIADRMLKAYADVVLEVAKNASDLMKTAVYNPDTGRAVEKKLRDSYELLNQQDRKWAEDQQAFGHITDDSQTVRND